MELCLIPRNPVQVFNTIRKEQQVKNNQKKKEKKNKEKKPFILIRILIWINGFIDEIKEDFKPLPKPKLVPEKYEYWLDNFPIWLTALLSSVLISVAINIPFLLSKGISGIRLISEGAMLVLLFATLLYLIHLLVLSFMKPFYCEHKSSFQFIYNEKTHDMKTDLPGFGLRIGDIRHKKFIATPIS